MREHKPGSLWFYQDIQSLPTIIGDLDQNKTSDQPWGNTALIRTD